jgi:hypothetical protein
LSEGLEVVTPMSMRPSACSISRIVSPSTIRVPVNCQVNSTPQRA